MRASLLQPVVSQCRCIGCWSSVTVWISSGSCLMGAPPRLTYLSSALHLSLSRCASFSRRRTPGVSLGSFGDTAYASCGGFAAAVFSSSSRSASSSRFAAACGGGSLQGGCDGGWAVCCWPSAFGVLSRRCASSCSSSFFGGPFILGCLWAGTWLELDLLISALRTSSHAGHAD